MSSNRSTGEHSAAISTAVITREKEFAWWRRLALCILAASLLALCLSSGGVPWGFYALTILYQGLVALLTYPFAFAYARISILAVTDDPACFVETHVYPRPLWGGRPPLLEEPGFWLSIPVLLAMAGIFGVLIWDSSRPGGPVTKDIGFVLFAFLLTGAVNALTEAYVWVTKGRPLLERVTGLDSVGVMSEAGYRWSWFWGWRR